MKKEFVILLAGLCFSFGNAEDFEQGVKREQSFSRIYEQSLWVGGGSGDGSKIENAQVW